ncbi:MULTISPECIES: ester cyclase [Anaeromyxobacter]|uniref:ester cyclase n=1 Tax=Anaeromyxobacter TaxID=161492 RepID=UPI001F5668CB|nr:MULTISPECIES: ester cyclase [unclassified Anaeromyxobacter]
MAVDIKQSHRRMFEEAWGKGNFGIFDELCDPKYRSHDPLAGDTDLEKTRELCRQYRDAFPDMAPTILGSFADHDTVITRWRMTGTHRAALMGIEPTGTRCTVEGITVGKFKGAKLVEEWTQWDALGLMRQLGVATAPQAGAGARATEKRPHA